MVTKSTSRKGHATALPNRKPVCRRAVRFCATSVAVVGNRNPPVEAGSHLVASEFLQEFDARDLKSRMRLLYELTCDRFAARVGNMQSMRSEVGMKYFHPCHKVKVHRLTMALLPTL